MAFKLPDLPYAYNALEPYIDEQTMKLHHDKHHAAYVTNLNNLVPGTEFEAMSLEDIIRKAPAGGVFNNADILSLDYGTEYTVERTEEVGAEALLHLKAKNRTVAYDRLRMWVNRAKALPVKIECLTEAGMLIKTLYFKEVKDFGGGIVRPSVIETDSPLHKGYKSVMIFAKIRKKTFRDEVFTLTFMPNLESLR